MGLGCCGAVERIAYVLMFAAFIFYAIALGLPKWSTGTATRNDDTGTSAWGRGGGGGRSGVCITPPTAGDAEHGGGGRCG